VVLDTVWKHLKLYHLFTDLTGFFGRKNSFWVRLASDRWEKVEKPQKHGATELEANRLNRRGAKNAEKGIVGVAPI